jgi:hypothetical protein
MRDGAAVIWQELLTLNLLKIEKGAVIAALNGG